MKWKNRLTNYNFWISIVSAVLLILQAFNFEFDIAYISEIATAVLGLLVVIGIISDPTKNYAPTVADKSTNKNNAEEIGETKQAEESEHNSIAVDVKNENDNVYTESNFQAIVDFISKEINKTVEEVVNSKKVEESSSEENANCYNIVN